MRRRRLSRTALYERASYLDLIDRLAANVLRLRVSAGWTQEQAAERCEMSPQLFQRVENSATNVTAATLARLADGLKVDVTVLLSPPRN